MRSCSNRVIELNQKMPILTRFVTKYKFFYVMMTAELFIKYFCSIQLCCLLRFDEKLFVFKYCFIFIVLGNDTSTQGSTGGKHGCDKGSSGSRGLSVCCGQ